MNLVLRTAGITAVLAIAFAGCGGGKNASTTTTTTTTTTATTAPAMGGATSGGAAAGAQAVVPADLNCGAVQPVWVNTRTHVYHEPTDPYYGKTKNGKYMCPSAAAAEGDRASGTHAGAMNSTDNGTTTGKHHKKKSSY